MSKLFVHHGLPSMHGDEPPGRSPCSARAWMRLHSPCSMKPKTKRLLGSSPLISQGTSQDSSPGPGQRLSPPPRPGQSAVASLASSVLAVAPDIPDHVPDEGIITSGLCATPEDQERFDKEIAGKPPQ